MPTKSSARWIADGDNMVKALQAKGYKADLQYAEDDIPNQLAQIENMITKGAKVLVIAAIDGTTLSDVLQKAADKGIKVIAYDRLIRDSPNVDYYATFDNFQVGVLQAQLDRRQGSALKDGKGPFNIELFGGSPDDNNAFFFYNGAMSVLQALHRQRQARRAEQADGHGQGRHAALGRRRRAGAHGQPAVAPTTRNGTASTRVLSPYDGLSIGIISSLKGVGYGTADAADAGRHRPGRRGAVGQVDHRAASSTRPSSRTPASSPRSRVNMVDAVLTGKTARGQRHQDLQQRRQGRSVVPAEAGHASTRSNYQQVLVDSGYYKAEIAVIKA